MFFSYLGSKDEEVVLVTDGDDKVIFETPAPALGLGIFLFHLLHRKIKKVSCPYDIKNCLLRYLCRLVKHVYFTEYCDTKKKTYIGAIEQYEHGVSGDIYACGDDQLVIEKFTYDGLAPDAFFWVGTGSNAPNSNGIILPHPFQGKFYDFEDTNAPILDKAYDGTQPPIVLEMPLPIKVSNLKWISVWCRQYEINFGDFVFANDLPSVETTSDTG